MAENPYWVEKILALKEEAEKSRKTKDIKLQSIELIQEKP